MSSIASGAELPQINGILVYFDNYEPSERGLVTVPTSPDGARQLLVQGVSGLYGGIEEEGVYYATHYENFMGFIDMVDIKGYDLSSGELVYHHQPSGMKFVSFGLAWDPTLQSTVGLFLTDDGTGLEIAAVDYPEQGRNAPSRTVITKVRNYPDGGFTAFAVDAEGGFHAVGVDGNLYSISRETGVATLTGATGYMPYYTGGAVIDHTTGRMYWTVYPESGEALFAEVSLSDGHATEIMSYDDHAEYTGIYIPRPEAAPDAPAACREVRVTATDGSMGAVATLTAPDALYDGSAPDGSLTVSVTVNGKIVATSPADWGADVNLPFVVDGDPGLYTFSVYASNGEGDGPRVKVHDVWIGADSPVAPAPRLSFADGMMKLAWDPVTASANGGHMDPAEVTYTVTRSDGSLAAEGIKVCEFAEQVETPSSITSYSYAVTASCGGLQSPAGRSNVVVLGEAVPPYAPDFAANGLDGFTVVNANGDGKRWFATGNAARINYNPDLAMDDWLITPPLRLEPGMAYPLSFRASGERTGYTERLEVLYGTSPDPAVMTHTILEPTEIECSTESPMPFDLLLAPPAGGVWYVGFHGISDPDQYSLYVSGISVGAPVSGAAPGMATDLQAAASPDGTLSAEISLTAPVVDLNGAPLADLSSLVLKRNGEQIHTFTNIQPNQRLSYTDDLPSGGDIQYAATGYNEAGEGLTAETSCFVGLSQPTAPVIRSISSPSEGFVKVEWEPVTHDDMGHALTGPVTYALLLAGAQQPIAMDIKECSYTWRHTAADEQDFVQCGVFACHDGSFGDGGVTDMIAVGTPYEGLHERGEFGSHIWGIDDTWGAQWGLGTPSTFFGIPAADGDSYFFVCQSQYIGEGGSIYSGLIRLDDAVNPKISYQAFNMLDESGAPDNNKIIVSLREAGAAEWTDVSVKTVAEICGDRAGWSKTVIDIPEFCGKTVQIMLTAVHESYAVTLVDGLRIGTHHARDLAVTAMHAPQSAPASKEFDIAVQVCNNGLEASGDFRLELLKGDRVAASMNCEELPADAYAVAAFPYTFGPADDAPVAFTARIVSALDQNPANDTCLPVSVAPEVSPYPAPADLEATCKAEGVILKWSPAASDAALNYKPDTEGFESGEAFSKNFGDWIFVDADKSPVGGFNNLTVPGIDPESTKMAFAVWDTAWSDIQAGNAAESFAAYGGSKYLFSIYRADDLQADDWAISPELPGIAQTVTFRARSYSGQFAEQIEVLWSEGGTSPSDFTKIEGVGGTVPEEWTLYTFKLPEGARRFAVRSCATGAFMLMLDDFTFVSTRSEAVALQTEGYALFKDGTQVAAVAPDAASWTDADVKQGSEYEYALMAVYKGLGYSAPAKVRIKYDTSGVDSMSSPALWRSGNGTLEILCDQPYTLHDVQGRGIAAGSSRTLLKLDPGIYLLRLGNRTESISIR